MAHWKHATYCLTCILARSCSNLQSTKVPRQTIRRRTRTTTTVTILAAAAAVVVHMSLMAANNAAPSKNSDAIYHGVCYVSSFLITLFSRLQEAQSNLFSPLSLLSAVINPRPSV
ncbi:hypothetical protein CPB84DRAFT_1216801 [Gymnopilus junonius]|uniref:Uncharacterized protein n=1 Tax=Gymnopilus junonius TaxID=109634 RepID=A0A9P5NZ80_GYMJU|nr:hypothetical protein CPB84DRAFT_1216801 [Gymnopilus junonius]